MKNIDELSKNNGRVWYLAAPDDSAVRIVITAANALNTNRNDVVTFNLFTHTLKNRCVGKNYQRKGIVPLGRRGSTYFEELSRANRNHPCETYESVRFQSSRASVVPSTVRSIISHYNNTHY